MIRNLVLKLPTLKCTSDYAFSSSIRTRNFRSLSPVQKARTTVGSERSVSCSRVESGHIVDVTRAPRARLLFSSKEYSAQKHDNVKEVQWRENPPSKKQADKEVEGKRTDSFQYETLEQYELEAAKPRPAKSRDVIEAFSIPKPADNGLFHLQPSQIPPYGSQNTMYSPSLIRPTNLLKYPRKFRQKTEPLDKEKGSKTDLDSTGFRKYSTSSEVRNLSTSKYYVAQERYRSNDVLKSTDGIEVQKKNDNLKFFIPDKKVAETNFNVLRRVSQFKEPWAESKRKLEISPPVFKPKRNMAEEVEMCLKISTPEMRQLRKKKENQYCHRLYKSSYSDLVKLRLKELKKEQLEVFNENPFNSQRAATKTSLGCFIKTNLSKSGQMLQVTKGPPEQRSFTTRSKSNLLSNKISPTILDHTFKNAFLSKPADGGQEQRHYSKSKDKKGKKKRVPDQIDLEAGCDVCTPIIKAALQKGTKPQIPMEPKVCEPPKTTKKVYLPSHVKLSALPTCLPPPDYRDCKKVDPCPPRADECLEVAPKKLPKLPAGDCLCINPHVPSKAPKLKELNLKFEDPPKIVCHPPPCQVSRADDSNPYKFKPLKPYVPGECDCPPTPRMKDVKLKRLPRCEPEDVCRPVRICPVIEKCPPRADESLKIESKQLPIIAPSPCPCIDPPMPKIAPPIKRLDLSVPEPARVCPKPPLCKERKRADDNLAQKEKRLPKFVPGDCPCEDRPMKNWNPKRLVCDLEEPLDCVVPDPCKAFPRADWGCWEYNDEICNVVDERCIEKDMKCPPPKPPKRHPCDKRHACKDNGGGIRELRHMPKRRYSKSSASLKLYQQIKSQNVQEKDRCLKTSANVYRPPEIKQLKTNTQKSAKSQKNDKKRLNLKSKSTVSLVKMLNDFELSKKNMEEPLLFRPKQDEKVNYDKILKKIASSISALPSKSEPKAGYLSSSLKKPQSTTLKVTSRAICTTKNVSKDEKKIKSDKDCKSKKTCKNMKPSIKSLICKNKKCPVLPVCRDMSREHRPACKRKNTPVCCEKEEPPYSAFTDNLEESIVPFTKTPQWTCNRVRYGFHPNYKKEHDPFDKKEIKDKKSFSTYQYGPGLNYATKEHQPINLPKATTLSARPISHETSRAIPIVSTKAFLKTTTNHVIITQNRTLSSKKFKIQPPHPGKPKMNKNCIKKAIELSKGEQITCVPSCEPPKLRRCCKRERFDLDCKRKPPPFPAFSDCLDEEMEDILTECPLDKEKYHRMQPRFMHSPKKPFTIKPPPPIQGKLDLLKEQECIRDKLCIPNDGLTQCCSDFGKPLPLMKSKKLIKDRKTDCERIEELKKKGRWPPVYGQRKRICTLTSANPTEHCRNLCTVGLNLIPEMSKENLSSPGVKRLYIRNYHALVKGTDKAILIDNPTKFKELTKKIFPDIDDSTKLLKLRKNQWNIDNFKNYYLNRQSNVFIKANRFYTTYKTRRRSFLRRHSKGCTLKTFLLRRRVSNNPKLLGYRKTNFRSTRSLKSEMPFNSAIRERSKIDINKKGLSKFTLNNSSFKVSQKSGQKKSSEKYDQKPFSPFPAYSERKKFSRFSDGKNIQPTCNVLKKNDNHQTQHFPEQGKLDKNMSLEYYKCKHGLKNEGCTFDCHSLGFCTKCKQAEDSHDENTKPKSRKRNMVELFVQEHRNQSQQASTKPCSGHSKAKINEDDCEEDKKNLEDICMQHCLKCIPCHLPEEEKYCVCQEECKKIFQKSEATKESLAVDHSKCNEEEDTSNSNIRKQDNCIKLVNNICDNTECDHSPGSAVTKTMDCSDCPPAPCEPEPCDSAPCGSAPNDSKTFVAPKKSKSITQLENLWQKIVNYFKARPNCPEPGEWKKKALKEKAEKAAKAAGLVVLNPKCLPPDILRTVKVSKTECKVCPNKDSCEKRDCDCDSNKSSSPRLSKRNFSTVPSRSYSRSSQNLEEINQLLEESEMRQRQLRYNTSNPNLRKEFAIFPRRKDVKSSKALKMSLDSELHKSVDLTELSCKDGQHSRTYFGYSDIIPSRENILERAWRISIESYNKYNNPKSYTFLNEFLNKIEKSIQSVEDLEKLKTENVLRELDEFLKNHDSDKNKK